MGHSPRKALLGEYNKKIAKEKNEAPRIPGTLSAEVFGDRSRVLATQGRPERTHVAWLRAILFEMYKHRAILGSGASCAATTDNPDI